jgi:hypothetical protein
MADDRPAPGSHDRSTPTGTLETSSATLFEAMLAARDAQERDPGSGDWSGDRSSAHHAFYRALMSGTVLLPVPPNHGEEARAALEAAVNDEQEVEISVMLARDPDGQPVNVLFGSLAALAAWSPIGSANLPLPARIAFSNLAANNLAAILDPAGPIPYRFEPEEVAALAAGQLPGTGEALFAATRRGSLVLRVPGPETIELEQSLVASLRETAVRAAYLVESETDDETRLLLGLVGDAEASATVDVPSGTDVVWLEEPLLSHVRAVADPFFERRR